MIGFLEFVGILFILYLVTQHLIPAIWPNQFKTNWFFKKKKPLDETVEQIANEKARLNEKIEETRDILRYKSEEVDRADKNLDQIKNS